MTYNWNTMVDITVPTGTNGWLYSGEVIINGIKVRFPVGVPTSVPEPAAVLLKKMIELEQEEADNTAKPDNHYVGSVTIPDGKVLKLDKGAKVEDPDGILGSAPAEVVILPETEATYSAEMNNYLIMTPLSATPTEGAAAKITYNGTAYPCTVAYFEEDGIGSYVLGNIDALGMPLTGGNPDAPFVVMIAPDGIDGAYGIVMPMEEVTSVTLSIVQTEGGSADSGSGDGGVFTARVVASASTKDMTLSDCDKTFPEIVAAYNAGKAIRIVASADDGAGEYVGSIAHAIVANGSPMMFLVTMPYGTCVSHLVHLLQSTDGTMATFAYHAGKPA